MVPIKYLEPWFADGRGNTGSLEEPLAGVDDTKWGTYLGRPWRCTIGPSNANENFYEIVDTRSKNYEIGSHNPILG